MSTEHENTLDPLFQSLHNPTENLQEESTEGNALDKIEPSFATIEAPDRKKKKKEDKHKKDKKTKDKKKKKDEPKGKKKHKKDGGLSKKEKKKLKKKINKLIDKL